MSTLQRAAPTITGRTQHEHKPRPARPHSLEEGNEQAGSNSLQLGGESTPHAASAQRTLQSTQPSTKARPRNQHMFRPTRDPPFGVGHEQAKHVLGQTPTKNKQKKLDDREMLQKRAHAPTVLHLPQDPGENAMIRLQRLTRNASHQPLEEGYEQASSSSLQLRRETMPHATFGPDILQSTQHTTNAKPRLLPRSVPTYVPAKRRMGQQQLGQERGNLQKKNPADSARQQVKAPTPMQQTHDPTKNAKLSPQGRAWAARDPPLGAGHEQLEADTVEPETGQTQPRPGEIFLADPLPPQKPGGAKFKILTIKRVSNPPADHATSIMSGHKGTRSE